MGMYDSLMVDCPKCGKPVEFQSKAWDCCLDSYKLSDAPTAILVDVMNEPRYCEKCGQWIALCDPAHPPDWKPRLNVVKVKTPDNPTKHFQGMQWWPDGVPFTFDEIEK